MKWAIRSGLLALFAILLAGNVKADSIFSYSLTGPGIAVTFSLPEFPSTLGSSNFSGDPADGFFSVNPADLKINGAPSSDTLAFLDAAMGGAFEDISNPMHPAFSLAGDQLYAGDPDENNPQMLLGTGTYTLFDAFNFFGDPPVLIPYTLDVTPVAAPEPSSLLLLGTGLMALVLVRKRCTEN